MDLEKQDKESPGECAKVPGGITSTHPNLQQDQFVPRYLEVLVSATPFCDGTNSETIAAAEVHFS
jgi:hypothetical protein